MAKIRLIDLGLPSGTKWGDRNFGADVPESEGNFVTWGGLDPHDASEGYYQNNYEFWKEFKESHEEEYTVNPKQYEEIETVDPSTGKTVKMYQEIGAPEKEMFPLPTGCTYDPSTKYIVDPQDPTSYEPHQETRIVTVSYWDMSKYNEKDGKKVLDSEDDAASVAFGAEFCLPSKEQWMELFENTKMTINGEIATFTAANGHSIVLPMAGCRHELYPCGNHWGEYWTKDLSDKTNAFRTIFSADTNGVVKPQWRIVGLQIRPVMK